MQNLTLAGTCGRDAELRQTQGGDPVLSFSIAVDNGKDANGNKREATWFDCSIWGKRATALQNHITKGSKLTVTGRPTAREHNGKVYLGCSVNELTFMGGGSRDSQPQGAPAGGYSGVMPSQGMPDDEIPFNPW
jgi:single-strand DNA-binding protein